MFESLEKRRMFTTMTVAATTSSDIIDIAVAGPLVSVSVNGGSPQIGLDSQVTDIVVNALGGSDIININSNGSNTVVINGGSGDDTINIAPTSQNLDSITDVVTINGDGGTDNVNFHDEGNASGQSYSFSNGNQLNRAGMALVTYSVESAALGASSASDTFNVNDPLATPFGLAANGGSDRLNINGDGTESMTYEPAAAQSNAGMVTFGLNLAFTDLESLFTDDLASGTFQSPNGIDNVSLANFGVSHSRLSGNSGGQTFVPLTFDNVDVMDVDLASNDSGSGDDGTSLSDGTRGTGLLRINNGGGNNAVTVNAGSYALDFEVGLSNGGNTLLTVSLGTVNFSNTQHIKTINLRDNGKVDFSAGALIVNNLHVSNGVGNIEVVSPSSITLSFQIDNNCTLIKTGAGTLTSNGAVAQIHGTPSLLDVRQGSFAMNSDAGSASSRTLNLMASGSGTLFLNNTQHVASVYPDLGGAITMLANGSRVLVTSEVFFNTDTGSGQLNLTNNDMIVDYVPGPSALPFIQSRINQGRNSGSWNGQGIISSSATAAPKNTTLGAMEATDYKSIYGPSATFGGETIDNTAVLVKYTYYGDANFNGKVDGGDYARIDLGFANHRSGWMNGDFNGDGKVDGGDYGLIDFAFGTQGTVQRPGGARS